MCKNCNCDPCWVCARRPSSIVFEPNTSCTATFFAETYFDGNQSFPFNSGPDDYVYPVINARHFPFTEQLFDPDKTVCESQWRYVATDGYIQEQSGTETVEFWFGKEDYDWQQKSRAIAAFGMALGPHIAQARFFDGEGEELLADPDGVANFFDAGRLHPFFEDLNVGLLGTFAPTIYAADPHAKRIAVRVFYEVSSQANYVAADGGFGAGFFRTSTYRVEIHTVELLGNCRNASGEISLTMRDHTFKSSQSSFGDIPQMNQFIQDLDHDIPSCLESSDPLMNVKVNLPA